jgi:hypothetical protein
VAELSKVARNEHQPISFAEVNVLPAFFSRADSISLEAQRRHVRATKFELLLLGLAATGAVIWTLTDRSAAVAIVASVALIGAFTIRAKAFLGREPAGWYQGRAAAESAKTLAWRYAVCGNPLPLQLGLYAADALILARFSEIASRLDPKVVDLAPIDDDITDWMRRLRSAPLEERRAVYEAERLRVQHGWYAAKAASNARQHRSWSVTLMAIEAAGVLLAIAQATELVDIDLLGLVATLGAGVIAWTGTRSHATLADAYGLTASEIETILSLVDSQLTEDQWQVFVAGAEDAISREHTMWSASRT